MKMKKWKMKKIKKNKKESFVNKLLKPFKCEN